MNAISRSFAQAVFCDRKSSFVNESVGSVSLADLSLNVIHATSLGGSVVRVAQSAQNDVIPFL